ncbi:hypothetical protein NQ317_001298 [Molorchus minor]|uniref:Cytochrome c oxidase subunit 5A, mitochondrial n=1 Tax=Molorchus minor TaxID=1323400 RepID=A0ABQ9JQD5_9CUCU|nr:hypothetical protein NQ317_001298 [Molorchus minor]
MFRSTALLRSQTRQQLQDLCPRTAPKPTNNSIQDRNILQPKDIDGWEIRQGVTDLIGHDLVPEPKIIIVILNACRRVNDFALAVRILETMKDKCGSKENEIYPYIIQEIRPTLTQLGINTPEELGFDKPPTGFTICI